MLNKIIPFPYEKKITPSDFSEYGIQYSNKDKQSGSFFYFIFHFYYYGSGREVAFTNHRQIIANTDTQLIIVIITLFTLFTGITLNVFGKTLCPCQSIETNVTID